MNPDAPILTTFNPEHDKQLATLREKLIQLIDMDLEMIAEDIYAAPECYNLPNDIALIQKYIDADYNPIIHLLTTHESEIPA